MYKKKFLQNVSKKKKRKKKKFYIFFLFTTLRSTSGGRSGSKTFWTGKLLFFLDSFGVETGVEFFFGEFVGLGDLELLFDLDAHGFADARDDGLDGRVGHL